MDPRHSLIVVLLLSGGCVEVDYATPCPDCSSHGLSTDGEFLATAAKRGIELYTVSEGVAVPHSTFEPQGGQSCVSPEVGAGHVSFACEDGAGRGSWLCRLADERCLQLTEAVGRGRILDSDADGVAVLVAWAGLEGEDAVVRVWRVTADMRAEPAWGPESAYLKGQRSWAGHDLGPRDGGARLVWLRQNARAVGTVDLDGRGEGSEPDTNWVSVDRGDLAGPMLQGATLVVTHRAAVAEVRAFESRSRSRVAAAAEGELLATGDSERPEVAALDIAGEQVLLGRLHPDGAALSLLGPRGETALGFAVGRPVAATAAIHSNAGVVAAWRDGDRPTNHFESVQPNRLEVALVHTED